MSDDRVDVQFGAQITSLLSGLSDATAGVRESVAGMKASLDALKSAAEAVLLPFLAVEALLKGGEMFGDAIKSTVEYGTQLEILHQKSGMSVEDLSQLEYAARQNRVSTESLTIGIQHLSRGMEEAEKRTGPAYDALKALGVNATDANGRLRPTGDVLEEVATKFHGMEDGAGKTAIAMDLFGRSGANLIPLLNQGAAGIDAFKRQADQLGLTMSGQDVEATKKYFDVMERFHSEMSALGRDLSLVIIPVLTKLTEWANTALEKILKLAQALKLMVPDLTSALDSDPDLERRLNPKKPAPQIGGDLLQQLEQQWARIKEMNADNFGRLTQLELSFWKSKVGLAEVGSKEYVAIARKIADLETQVAHETYDAQLGALKAKEAADKDDLEQVVADRQAELEIIRRHYGEMTKEVQEGIARVNEAQDALRKQTAKQWEQVFNSIPAAFDSAMQGIGKNVTTMRELFRQFFVDLTKMSIEWGAATLRNHIAVELAKKNVTAAGVAERVALETWGALQSVAKSAWAALINIANYAAQAIAATWASISAIPIVGPFLAPAVAVGVGAAVIGLAGQVHSAAGGFDIPSGVNPMTQLHAQEMVLPADLANRIRGMAGGGGGDTHLHVHTMDVKGVRQFVMDNRDIVADAARRAVKDGRKSTRGG